MANFPERLKFLRNRAKLSQRELAAQTGINSSSIAMYEQGKREPGIETLELICDYFNVDMNYLIGKSDIENSVQLAVQMINGEMPTAQGSEHSPEALQFAKEFSDFTPAEWAKVVEYAEFLRSRRTDKDQQ